MNAPPSADTVDVSVQRVFPVPAERVFDAWLTPRLLGQWMFGPGVRDEKVLRLDVDPRVGGRFSMLVERDGTRIDHVGEYLVIDRPHRLSFTWGIAGESD
ncbi:MAG TPA: SRPBCC family protein [Pseudoxanthomonas sp.]